MKILMLSLLLSLALSVSAQSGEKVRCAGITAKKEQCSRMVDSSIGYCFQHNPAAVRCKGMTKKNEPCKLLAKKGSDFCWRHQG